MDSHSLNALSSIAGVLPFGFTARYSGSLGATVGEVDRDILVIEPELVCHPERAIGARQWNPIYLQIAHGGASATNFYAQKKAYRAFVDLSDVGLASMYPASHWSVSCSGPPWISARMRSHQTRASSGIYHADIISHLHHRTRWSLFGGPRSCGVRRRQRGCRECNTIGKWFRRRDLGPYAPCHGAPWRSTTVTCTQVIPYQPENRMLRAITVTWLEIKRRSRFSRGRSIKRWGPRATGLLKR